MPGTLTTLHTGSMETARSRHDQIIVEIAYVVISSALLLSLVVLAEWIAWRAFSLGGSNWRSVGDTIVILVLAALAVRGTRLFRRFGGQ
jgi:hypothetical protein